MAECWFQLVEAGQPRQPLTGLKPTLHLDGRLHFPSSLCPVEEIGKGWYKATIPASVFEDPYFDPSKLALTIEPATPGALSGPPVWFGIGPKVEPVQILDGGNMDQMDELEAGGQPDMTKFNHPTKEFPQGAPVSAESLKAAMETKVAHREAAMLADLERARSIKIPGIGYSANELMQIDWEKGQGRIPKAPQRARPLPPEAPVVTTEVNSDGSIQAHSPFSVPAMPVTISGIVDTGPLRVRDIRAPAQPTDHPVHGELIWDSQAGTLSVYNSSLGQWNPLALTSDSLATTLRDLGIGTGVISSEGEDTGDTNMPKIEQHMSPPPNMPGSVGDTPGVWKFTMGAEVGETAPKPPPGFLSSVLTGLGGAVTEGGKMAAAAEVVYLGREAVQALAIHMSKTGMTAKLLGDSWLGRKLQARRHRRITNEYWYKALESLATLGFGYGLSVAPFVPEKIRPLIRAATDQIAAVQAGEVIATTGGPMVRRALAAMAMLPQLAASNDEELKKLDSGAAEPAKRL